MPSAFDFWVHEDARRKGLVVLKDQLRFSEGLLKWKDNRSEDLPLNLYRAHWIRFAWNVSGHRSIACGAVVETMTITTVQRSTCPTCLSRSNGSKLRTFSRKKLAKSQKSTCSRTRKVSQVSIERFGGLVAAGSPFTPMIRVKILKSSVYFCNMLEKLLNKKEAEVGPFKNSKICLNWLLTRAILSFEITVTYASANRILIIPFYFNALLFHPLYIISFFFRSLSRLRHCWVPKFR